MVPGVGLRNRAKPVNFVRTGTDDLNNMLNSFFLFIIVKYEFICLMQY